jgi:hypothetical protein
LGKSRRITQLVLERIGYKILHNNQLNTPFLIFSSMVVAPKWLKIFKATCLDSIYDILVAPKVAAPVKFLLFSISFVCFAIR